MGAGPVLSARVGTAMAISGTFLMGKRAQSPRTLPQATPESAAV